MWKQFCRFEFKNYFAYQLTGIPNIIQVRQISKQVFRWHDVWQIFSKPSFAPWRTGWQTASCTADRVRSAWSRAWCRRRRRFKTLDLIFQIIDLRLKCVCPILELVECNDSNTSISQKSNSSNALLHIKWDKWKLNDICYFLQNLLQAVLNPVGLRNLQIGMYGCYPKVHNSFEGNSNLEFGCNFHQGRSNIGGHRDLNFFQKIVLKS